MKYSDLSNELFNESKVCLLLAQSNKGGHGLNAIKGKPTDVGHLIYQMIDAKPELFPLVLASLCTYIDNNPEYISVTKEILSKIKDWDEESPFN